VRQVTEEDTCMSCVEEDTCMSYEERAVRQVTEEDVINPPW
jgi:hypothetical protein